MSDDNCPAWEHGTCKCAAECPDDRTPDNVALLREWSAEAYAKGERFAELGSGLAATKQFARGDALRDAADRIEADQ